MSPVVISASFVVVVIVAVVAGLNWTLTTKQ